MVPLGSAGWDNVPADYHWPPWNTHPIEPAIGWTLPSPEYTIPLDLGFVSEAQPAVEITEPQAVGRGFTTPSALRAIDYRAVRLELRVARGRIGFDRVA